MRPEPMDEDLTRDPPGILELRAIRQRMHDEATGDIHRFFENVRRRAAQSEQTQPPDRDERDAA